MVRGHKEILDIILLDGLHPLDPFSPSVLGSKIIDVHPLDIA